jgi:hypothetical protein
MPLEDGGTNIPSPVSSSSMGSPGCIGKMAQAWRQSSSGKKLWGPKSKGSGEQDQLGSATQASCMVPTPFSIFTLSIARQEHAENRRDINSRDA